MIKKQVVVIGGGPSGMAAATQLPVFDFITLIKWMHSAVMQRPYAGWM